MRLIRLIQIHSMQFIFEKINWLHLHHSNSKKKVVYFLTVYSNGQYTERTPKPI